MGEVQVTSSGAIIYRMWDAARPRLWSIGPGRGARRSLAPDDLRIMRSLVVACQTDLVLFTAKQQDEIPHVFRVDADGQNLARLTNGGGEIVQTVSPDGTTMLLTDSNGALWKYPIPAGPTVKVAEQATVPLLYSPDGK